MCCCGVRERSGCGKQLGHLERSSACRSRPTSRTQRLHPSKTKPSSYPQHVFPIIPCNILSAPPLRQGLQDRGRRRLAGQCPRRSGPLRAAKRKRKRKRGEGRKHVLQWREFATYWAKNARGGAESARNRSERARLNKKSAGGIGEGRRAQIVFSMGCGFVDAQCFALERRAPANRRPRAASLDNLEVRLWQVLRWPGVLPGTR